jgi:ABC-type transporter Mla maintaining outer membrane lipid asymmetry permease subunit MlaE
MPGFGLVLILLFVIPHVAGMTGAHHYTQPLVEIGLAYFWSRLASNCSPYDLCLCNN